MKPVRSTRKLAAPPAQRRRLRRAAVVAAALLAIGGAAGAVAAADGDDAPARAGAGTASPAPAAEPCGPDAAAAAAHAVGDVARRIYDLERSSPEVRADRRQVEGDEALLAAMASGEAAAIRRAVTALVFSGTHIVRLRVTAHGSVLADVGGPYIIAPVGGPLRFHGRSVGRYLLSVQDDLGYVKLEQRFIGYPLILRSGGRRVPVAGTLPADAAALPHAGPVTYHGSTFELAGFEALAFPAGRLEVTLLVPPPASAPLTCHAVAERELFAIGKRIWHRFIAVSAPVSAYVHALPSLTGAFVFVRSGSLLLAGSSRPAPPLRDSGIVRYRGGRYDVGSFASRAGGRPVRVFQLLPAS